jgi:hypothetical protein
MQIYIIWELVKENIQRMESTWETRKKNKLIGGDIVVFCWCIPQRKWWEKLRCRKEDPFAFLLWYRVIFKCLQLTSTYIENGGPMEKLEQKIKLEREGLGERGSIM